MRNKGKFIKGTHSKIKKAWLLTWMVAGEHHENKDEFVAIISARHPDKTIKKILEQYYVSTYLALHEQFSYVKSKQRLVYKVENALVQTSIELQKNSSLPAQVPSSESMIIGGNPWLWARIVYDLEAWVQEDGTECLFWKEQENIVFDGEFKYDLKEQSLRRTF